MAIENKIFLSTRDYSISNEKFDLIYNESYDMLETYPRPAVDDIGKYYESEVYISHTDSRKLFTDKLYQWVKKYTLTQKLKLLNSLSSSEKTLLDIGCGTGDFLVKCNGNQWTVTGVEPDDNARSLARNKFAKKREIEIVATLENLGNKKFGVITLWHVLEHVHDVFDYIDKIKKHLYENGFLIIAVPNYKSFDAEYYEQHWAAYDVPRHLWHFSKNAIKKIFLEKEMQMLKILPMPFDAFYVALLSEQYKNKKVNFLKAFMVGLRSNLNALKTKEYSSQIYILKMPKK